MYTFFKNPMRLKDCYLQKCIGWQIIFYIISSSNKTSTFSFIRHAQVKVGLRLECHYSQ
jgi:hypothetical protein